MNIWIFGTVHKMAHIHMVILLNDNAGFYHAVTFCNLDRCRIIIANDRKDPRGMKFGKRIFLHCFRCFNRIPLMPICSL